MSIRFVRGYKPREMTGRIHETYEVVCCIYQIKFERLLKRMGCNKRVEEQL
jgi:hypothetical protein